MKRELFVELLDNFVCHNTALKELVEWLQQMQGAPMRTASAIPEGFRVETIPHGQDSCAMYLTGPITVYIGWARSYRDATLVPSLDDVFAANPHLQEIYEADKVLRRAKEDEKLFEAFNACVQAELQMRLASTQYDAAMKDYTAIRRLLSVLMHAVYTAERMSNAS